MTPERNEPTSSDEPENGVLADTGAVDTTGLGILGGSTAQVSVEMPAGDDDDLDDDIVGDEVEVFEILEDDDFPTLDGDAVAVEAEDLAAEPTAVAAFAATVDADIVDADELIDDDFDDAAGEPTESTVEAEIVTDAASDRDDSWVHAPEQVVQVPTTTGAIPTSRREAHAETTERFERVHAVERTAAPRPEVALTSKRLGEFEPGRESADLLTADRLLDPHQVVHPEPEGVWQHFVYSLTGHRINLGDGRRARARKALDRRIAAPLGVGARFVPVVSRKGGVGKTTITTLLGMALADARDDRIIAVDANPDRGTLADRIARQNGKTVRDLVRDRGEISGYAGISSVVARDDTRLDVVASDADPRVSEAFSDNDYQDVAALAAHYYSIVLTDTGTGIVHSVMQATLAMADQLVVVAGLSVDEARLASETLTWLETNGYAEQVRNAVVVLNTARPGTPLVRPDELETHFRTRVRAVVRMPYDPHIAAGSAITFRDLRPETRLAARELAASVVEGLRALSPAA